MQTNNFCISDGLNCPTDFEAFGDNCYFIDFNVQVPYNDVDFYCTKEDENAFIITILVAFPIYKHFFIRDIILIMLRFSNVWQMGFFS